MQLIGRVMVAGAVFGLLIASNPITADVTTTQLATTGSEVQSSLVDDLTEKEIAAVVAATANVINVDPVSLVTEAHKELGYVPQTTQVAKTQVVKTDTETRHDIVKHKVASGETLASIADKYGVSADSIKWASDLRSNYVSVGYELTIPPVDGVIYTVKAGDTADTLAQKYSADADDIIAFNDAEISGLKTGMKIIIPGGEQPTVRTNVASYVSSYTPTYVGNGYYYGWCTWYAANRRAELGKPIPTNWHDANMWDNYAGLSGYKVTSVPVVGAVAQTDRGPWGHVAVVEQVSADRTQIKISDMNGIAGWGRVGHSDWIPASKYKYIY